jgi:hypothetical protein
MESKKNELYGKVFQFVPNHKLIKKGDLVIENNINYEYKGKSVDGMAVLLREDGDFKLKTIKPKLIEKISYQSLKDMKLKLLTINKNNMKRVLVF